MTFPCLPCGNRSFESIKNQSPGHPPLDLTTRTLFKSIFMAGTVCVCAALKCNMTGPDRSKLVFSFTAQDATFESERTTTDRYLVDKIKAAQNRKSTTPKSTRLPVHFRVDFYPTDFWLTFRYYRKRGSASYIVREVLSLRERERDTDRERESRKWRHHCRAKIGDEFTLSLAKNSHFSFLPSHSPSLPSRRGHHCGAEIRNEFTLSIAKIFFAQLVLPLLNGTSRATSDRKPKTNDQILASPILFFPSKKWIKLIPKTIRNRKRDCAWGGSGW